MPRRSIPVWVLLVLNAAAAHSAAEQTAEFRLLGTDIDGRHHQLGASANCRAFVVVFLATDCPVSNGCLPALNQLAEAYRREGVEFYGVVSDETVTRKEAVAHRDRFRIRFSVLYDNAHKLRSHLRPTHTPEAFVLTPAGKIVYRGAIDDQFADLGRKRVRVNREYVREAIDAVLQRRDLPVAYVKPVGCLLEPLKPLESQGAVTYCLDVAPILFEHCAACHRPGEVAPFSLLTYRDAARRAQQIALVARRRLMPPWKAVAGFGKFRNERRLSDREIDVLQKWAETGAAFGDKADLPAAPGFPDGWQLGEPDLVLQLPEPFDVPADGPDIYQHFVLPSGITKNQLISAMEFRPTNPRVVHHALVYFDVKGVARRLDDEAPGQGYPRFGGPGFTPDGGLGGWGPGGIPRRLPADTGRLMWAGSDVVVQLHYHPNGRAERDRSRLGLYFAPREARKLATDIMVSNVDLSIPAGEKRHRHEASYTLPVDTTLLDATPHMHLLGREMQVTATTPDREQLPLIWIKDYDFNWQDHYVFDEPVHLPAGTRIDMVAWYDNSAGNPQNPNSPPREVDWGDFSDDEMGICYFQATTDNFGDFEKLIKHSAAYYQRQLERLESSR